MTPGRLTPDAEPDWWYRDRALTDMATRYTRLMAWVFALSTALLFFSIAVSVASIEFGIVPPGGGAEYFSHRPANPGDVPNRWP